MNGMVLPSSPSPPLSLYVKGRESKDSEREREKESYLNPLKRGKESEALHEYETGETVSFSLPFFIFLSIPLFFPSLDHPLTQTIGLKSWYFPDHGWSNSIGRTLSRFIHSIKYFRPSLAGS